VQRLSVDLAAFFAGDLHAERQHSEKVVKGKFLIAIIASGLATFVSANEQVLSKAGCIGCHRIDQKINGPAFKDIAARYKNDADAPQILFAKIREGGEGVWGDLPMVPNGPEKISDNDLRGLIRWILAL
jgi:cytochrome c